MRTIIKQVIKEEIESKYQDKLKRISDKLIEKLIFNINSKKQHDPYSEEPTIINFKYIKSMYGLPDNLTRIIYDTFRNKRNELSLKWLNDNFGNMKQKQMYSNISYSDIHDNLILYYHVDTNVSYSLAKKIRVDFELVWGYFSFMFGMEDGEIENVIKKWLEETYNIKGFKPLYDTLN
jgi:hypothetical protein